MKYKKIDEEKIAECVGLWLAEGDNKSKSEITFTNSEFILVSHFHSVLRKIFQKYQSKIRLYVYSPYEHIRPQIYIKKIKYYTDKRASRPYFIWRLASVELVKYWKSTIDEVSRDPKNYPAILRGFFAGEGSVKEGKRNVRLLKISQGKRLPLIDKILNYFDVKYQFTEYHRNGYIISRRENIQRLHNLGIANLYPTKKIKLDKMLNSYKQTHYKKGFLKNSIVKLLRNHHYTTVELSKIFERSQYRISETLSELKRDGAVKNYRVRSKDYWISDKQNKVIISRVKAEYLKIIGNKKVKAIDVSKLAKKSPRSTVNRLMELKKLKLIKRNSDKTWNKVRNTHKIIVI